MKLLLTEAALADLDAIGEWIAKDNPARALSFVQELRAACAAFPEMPEAHRLIPRYERYNIRRKVHGNYLVFYRVEPNAIEIVHILHGARDYETILFRSP